MGIIGRMYLQLGRRCGRLDKRQRSWRGFLAPHDSMDGSQVSLPISTVHNPRVFGRDWARLGSTGLDWAADRTFTPQYGILVVRRASGPGSCAGQRFSGPSARYACNGENLCSLLLADLVGDVEGAGRGLLLSGRFRGSALPPALRERAEHRTRSTTRQRMDPRLFSTDDESLAVSSAPSARWRCTLCLQCRWVMLRFVCRRCKQNAGKVGIWIWSTLARGGRGQGWCLERAGAGRVPRQCVDK